MDNTPSRRLSKSALKQALSSLEDLLRKSAQTPSQTVDIIRTLYIELLLRHSSSETVNALPRRDSNIIKEIKLRILKEGVFDKEIVAEMGKFS